MRSRFTILLFFTVILTNAQTSFTSIKMARMAANWLDDLEVELNGEISWPEYNGITYSNTGYSTGSAGIGTFFVKLFELTEENDFLNKAKATAEHIYSNYVLHDFNGPDYLDGAASGGNYFALLYRTCGEEKYLDYAKHAADWLIDQAIIVNGNKCYWKHSPTFPRTYIGLAHGAAGIAYFLAEVYDLSKDEKYLNIVEMAVNWIDDYSLELGNGIGYKRLTTDLSVNNLWCGGTTGIMELFEKLYIITNDETYLNKLTTCANGLLHNAITDGDNSIFWDRSPPGDYNSKPVAYCHGTSSTANVLLKVWILTNDQRYYEAAIKGLNFVKETKAYYRDSIFYYPHIVGYEYIETGYFIGQASIGRAFLEAYQITDSIVYLDLASEVKVILLRMATINNNKMCWDSYINNVDNPYEPKRKYTSMFSGAAGIGVFLVDLYNYDKDETVITVSNQEMLVSNSSLLQNYPNPFISKTTISFELRSKSNVVLHIVDISGTEIKQFDLGEKMAGSHSINIQLDDLTSGVYFYYITPNYPQQTKKLLLIK